MASRSRLQWKPDPRGYFTRQIGWKISRSGKTQQHKFILGTDRREAEARERKLRELWDQFEKTSSIPRPTWPEGLLRIAERVAKGDREMPVPRLLNESHHSYATRIIRMQVMYPVICFLPEDKPAYDTGVAASKMFEVIPRSKGEIQFPNISIEQLTAMNKISAPDDRTMGIRLPGGNNHATVFWITSVSASLCENRRDCAD